RDQIPYRGVFLPSVPDVVDGRSCPHGGNGDFRHFDLVARPIGEARIGGERRAPQGQSNGDGQSACNATYPSIQAPTFTVCTTRRRSANWPGTSAMDGGLATRLELISSTIARWRGPTTRSISGLR